MKLSALLVTLSSIVAFAQEAAPAQPQGGGIMGFLPIILLFVVMWLFFIRPKNKEMKQMEEMRKALKKGDKVMTTAGIIGTVTRPYFFHDPHRIREGRHPPRAERRSEARRRKEGRKEVIRDKE